MRVLALTSPFPRAQFATPGTSHRDTLLALTRHCEVRVVAPSPAWSMLARPLDLLSPRRDRSSGLDAMFPPFYSIPGASCVHASAMALSLRGALRRLHEELPWDIMIAACAYPHAAAAAHFARWWDTPLVTVARGNDLCDLPSTFGLRPQIQWALSRSERVVTATSALAERAVELGTPRERVVVERAAIACASPAAAGERYFTLLEEVLREWRERRATMVTSHPR